MYHLFSNTALQKHTKPRPLNERACHGHTFRLPVGFSFSSYRASALIQLSFFVCLFVF